ncbi:MAG: hypothetical protein ACRD5B_17185, partial [Nitrososphaeraceae archaeon]
MSPLSPLYGLLLHRKIGEFLRNMHTQTFSQRIFDLVSPFDWPMPISDIAFRLLAKSLLVLS